MEVTNESYSRPKLTRRYEVNSKSFSSWPMVAMGGSDLLKILEVLSDGGGNLCGGDELVVEA